MDTDITSGAQRIPLSKLRLDWANPRLPIELHERSRSQHDIAALIDRDYDPLSVAQSISRHGFFESEPLIAIADGDAYRVLEGNRRLTALMALSDGALRERLGNENRGWNQLMAEDLPEDIPVVVVKSESDVDAVLGFRHISGIDPWSPYQQAQFVAKLVDTRGLGFDDVAEVVGRSGTEVRAMYRDFDILRQATGENIDVQRARGQFSVFSVAMGRPVLRQLIAAPDPRDVDPDYMPYDPNCNDELRYLLGLLFGTDTESRVIGDSREIKHLVPIFSDETGVAQEVLRESRSIPEALEALGGMVELALRAMGHANRHLRRAADHVEAPPSEEFLAAVAVARELLDNISDASGINT